MKFLFLGLCLFFYLALPAQLILKGIVVGEKNNPIPGASVFLNNTSTGTRANDQGRFELSLPQGKFELVVSSIGYETYSRAVSASDLTGIITIQLKLKNDVMETVVVEPYEKDGWEKWGKFFIDNFIGQSAFSSKCTIKNWDIIRFRHSKKTNRLTAYADEPLIIENKALGYTIFYQMETFSYDFNKRFLIYTGYPFFQPMKGGTRLEKKWEKNRSQAYYGSMMHFMRTLYRNHLSQDGFEVRRLQKIENKEKKRVRSVMTKNGFSREINKDSSEYYNTVLRQPDENDIIGRAILPGDSIAYAVSNTTAGMDFDQYLLVTYKTKPAPLEYRQQFPKNSTAIQSQLVLINKRPLEIESNGSYFDPGDLLSIGYWAWSEKMAICLPFDYEPSKE